MTATKETTFASSFVVILTVITTMTRKDDVIQGRGVITESFACAYMESLLVSPDGAWSRQMVPWAVKRVIVQFNLHSDRDACCATSVPARSAASETHTIRAALFDVRDRDGMSDGEFPFPEPLVDGIIREEWSGLLVRVPLAVLCEI